tara:strand:- start:268 stop:579 length:312 start_codon:yes stop_codon:yes gene_type:complete
MKINRLTIFELAILFFLAGCGTMGKDFNASKVNNIQNHVTSQSEILKNFGIPFKEGTQNGMVMWTYQFDEYSAIGSDNSKDLVILFDKKDTVNSYRFTSTRSK